MNKRAAIELSMTTIIVIILGVSLLSLGLVWIKNTLGQVGELTDDSFTIAKDLIQQDMAPGDTFYVSGYSINAKQGGFTVVYTGIQFFDADPTKVSALSLSITGEEAAAAGITFQLPNPIPTRAGTREGLPFGINIPKNVPKGETYSATITAFKDGEFYEAEIILIKVV